MPATFTFRRPGALLGAVLILCALSACNKGAEAPAQTSKLPDAAAPVSLGDLKDKSKMDKVVQASLPTGDKATPLASYRKLDSGNQIMFLYYGLSNLPVDYEKIANVYSKEYRENSDSFKKKDILTALQPRMAQEIAQAKSARYVTMDNRGSDLLSRYDFSKKSFAVPSLSDNIGYNYFYDNSEYKVTRTNATAFSAFSVPDETMARTIEGYLSKNANLKLEIYSFAQDINPTDQIVKLEVMKVRLLSPTGEVLAEQ